MKTQLLKIGGWSKTLSVAALLLAPIVLPEPAVATPFNSCPADTFLAKADSGDKAHDIFIVNLFTGDETEVGSDITDRSNQSYLINAIGYNPTDDYIYGYDIGRQNAHILRLDSNYDITDLDVIAGLPTGRFNVGDVNRDGELYLYHESRNDFYVVNVDSTSSDFLDLVKTVPIPSSPNFSDWGFNPLDDQLYAIEKVTSNLLRINPDTGAIENLGATGLSNDSYGAVYFDRTGAFYVSNNSSGELYRIDISEPTSLSNSQPIDPTTQVTFLATGQPATRNDGARCAAAPVPIDYGDAPDTGSGVGTGNYQTLIGDGGAFHGVDNITFLGSGVTVDVDGFGDGIDDSASAADDTNDDGVGLNGRSLQGQRLNVDTVITLDVATTGNGLLNAWIDWDRNGTFDPDEQIAQDDNVASGTLNVTVPSDAVLGTTYGRFRYSSQAGLIPTGRASDGEVEDYQIEIVGQTADQTPNVLLVKRITAINGSASTSDGYSLAQYFDEPGNQYDDNYIAPVSDPNNAGYDPANANPFETNQWPTIDGTLNSDPLLKGGIHGGKVLAHDEIEYTIYFLSSGNTVATNVVFCDYIPPLTSFIPNGYSNGGSQATGGMVGTGLGVELYRNGFTEHHTGAADGDSAVYFPPGIDPARTFPNLDCDGDGNGINTNANGAVVVNLGDLPNATTNATDAYGYVQFRARVN
ncbi:MAG: DUF11 domain-containing protein [Cyanobacteria bacterium P01_D01_bin.56]